MGGNSMAQCSSVRVVMYASEDLHPCIPADGGGHGDTAAAAITRHYVA